MANEALNGPSRSIAVRADRVAFDFLGDLEQRIDFSDFGLPTHHALHDAPEPAGAFAAGRALAATFMHVEMAEAGDGIDNIGRFIHHDEAGSTEAGFRFAQAVKIHQHRFAYFFWQY